MHLLRARESRHLTATPMEGHPQNGRIVIVGDDRGAGADEYVPAGLGYFVSAPTGHTWLERILLAGRTMCACDDPLVGRRHGRNARGVRERDWGVGTWLPRPLPAK
jgi:hypothetical protein